MGLHTRRGHCPLGAGIRTVNWRTLVGRRVSVVLAMTLLIIVGSSVGTSSASPPGVASAGAAASMSLIHTCNYDSPATTALRDVVNREISCEAGGPGHARGAAVAAVNSRFAASVVAAEGDEFVNLPSDARTTHILEGDATGGGHQWPGLAGKTPFPENWSGARIMNEISDIATDPDAWSNAVTQGGRTVLTGMRDGVQIRVVVDSQTGEIISGYPTNLPRNP